MSDTIPSQTNSFNTEDSLSVQIAVLNGELDELRERIAALEAMGDEKQLFSVKDLMQRWSLSERKVRNLFEEGYLEPTYIGSSLRVTRQMIQEYETNQTGWGKGKSAKRIPTTIRINPDTGYAERVRLPPRPPGS